MVALGAVAGGEDAVVTGAALVVVDAQRSAVADLEARLLGERDGRLRARADHHVVGGVALAVGAHLDRHAVGVADDLLDRRVQHDADAVTLGRLLDVRRHVGVERQHDLRRAIDHRHLQPALGERLGHLEADVARPDDDRAAPALVDRVAEALAGVDGAGGLDRLGAVDRRRRGLGAGRDDELVEGLGRLAAAAVAHRQRARGEVDREDLAARAHVDAVVTVALRSAADQPARVLDDAADEIRDAAGRVRGERAALERDDLKLRVAAPRNARGAHAGGVPTDDRKPPRHRRSLRRAAARARRPRALAPPAVPGTRRGAGARARAGTAT